jgi:hypothetical protein
VLVALPAVASASIVPGVSIAGVRLGDSQSAVRSRIGAPSHTQAGPPGSQVERWDYLTHDHLTVQFDHGRVTSVFVSAIPSKGLRPVEKTPSGQGLGSPMSAFAKAYPGACSPPVPGRYPPVCSFQRGTRRMSIMVSGRYGMGWKAPAETIILQEVGR